MDQMQDDDGFGDFRAKVKGLPREQRMAELKKMEDAVLENLRSNMLADLYAEDQPAPAPQQRQPPTGDSSLDASLGRVDPNSVDQDDPDYEEYMGEYEDELRDGGMTPENEPERFKQAMQDAPRNYDKNRARPAPKAPMGAIIDDEEPLAFGDVASPTKFQTPQGGNKTLAPEQVDERGRTYMGKTAPPDGAAWEDDPDQPAYTFPLPVGSMRGKPYPTEREFGGGDTYYSNLYRWQKDNGAPEWQDGTQDGGPAWKQFVDEYHKKNNMPPPVDERKFRDFIGRETGLSGRELYDVMNGNSDAVSEEQYNDMLQRFRAGGARTPAPKAQGMFGRPPGGITANRMMIDE